MATKSVDDKLKLLDWRTRCEAIAESDLFVRIGHPEDQVIGLMATLMEAAGAGVNWREIYRWIYDQWHTQRPLLPDLSTMAAAIDEYRSPSKVMSS